MDQLFVRNLRDPEDWVNYADTDSDSEAIASESDNIEDDDEFKDDRDWVLAPFEYDAMIGQVVVMNSVRFLGLGITRPFRMFRVVELGTGSRLGQYMVHELVNNVGDTLWTGWYVSSRRHQWVYADACFGDVMLFRRLRGDVMLVRPDGHRTSTVHIDYRRSILDFVARGNEMRDVRLDPRR